jgi:hypothetical protein
VSALQWFLVLVVPYLTIGAVAVPALLDWPRPASGRRGQQARRGPSRPVVDWGRAVLA